VDTIFYLFDKNRHTYHFAGKKYKISVFHFIKMAPLLGTASN